MAKKTRAKRAKAKKAVKRPAPPGRTRTKKRAPATPARRTDGSTVREAPRKIAARLGHISVRMYNNILGDCFLIRIPAGNREVKVLIDCGVLQGMPGASDIIGEIAADI